MLEYVTTYTEKIFKEDAEYTVLLKDNGVPCILDLDKNMMPMIPHLKEDAEIMLFIKKNRVRIMLRVTVGDIW